MPEIVTDREAADESLEAVVPIFRPLVRPLLELADGGKAIDFGDGHRAHAHLKSRQGGQTSLSLESLVHSNTIRHPTKQTRPTIFNTYTSHQPKGWARPVIIIGFSGPAAVLLLSRHGRPPWQSAPGRRVSAKGTSLSARNHRGEPHPPPAASGPAF